MSGIARAAERGAERTVGRGIDRGFAALADPTRLAVVELLHRAPHRAGELADALGLSPPALSRHLKVLRRHGLIDDDAVAEDARVRLYRLQPAAFASMRDWLGEMTVFWDEQLQSFKAHAEAAPGERRGSALRRAR